MENAIETVFNIAILLMSVVIHEVSHGYAALRLGDRTAQFAGRLTLNPLNHLDPVGSVIVPIVSSLAGIPFGWAKPVPYNPYNLRNQKWGPAIVGAAGPGVNIALAAVFGLIVRFLPEFSQAIPGPFFFNFIAIATSIAFINLFLAFFNLLPLPPLDGSKLLFALLPYRYNHIQQFLEQYGFYILIFFIFFFGGGILLPLVRWTFYLIRGSFPI